MSYSCIALLRLTEDNEELTLDLLHSKVTSRTDISDVAKREIDSLNTWFLTEIQKRDIDKRNIKTTLLNFKVIPKKFLFINYHRYSGSIELQLADNSRIDNGRCVSGWL